jgi:xanthine dehydrogenase accessory factor
VALPRDAQVGPAKDQLQPRSADEGGAVCFSASRVA